MGLIDRLLPAKAAITSSSIRAEIERSESEIAAHSVKIAGVLNDIASMNDEQHVAAEANVAALRRAIARLDARVATLTNELPAIIAAEEAAAKAEADAALLKRTNAARKSNATEAKKLLEQYESAALAVVDALAKLDAITAETAAVNTALRANPIAETVTGWNDLHRKAPDQQATERRESVPHWIYRDASPQPGEAHPGATEEAVRCTIDHNGKPLHPAGVRYGRGGNVITPTLEQRSVVVSSQRYRPGLSEAPLDSVQLPGAWAGQGYIWPRQ